MSAHISYVVSNRTPAQGAYDEGYGTVLDSGTTFTYLPTAAFVPFLAAVKRFAISRGLHMTTGPDKAVRQPERYLSTASL